MKYIQINTDAIKESVTSSRTIDLASYKARLLTIKVILDELPQRKSKADTETLRAYNEWVDDERANADIFVQNAKQILKELKDIYDAGQLPEKYVQPLTQFNNYINKF